MTTMGLPLVCPKCPSKHYFGVLKLPAHLAKLGGPVGSSASCPNCNTKLIMPKDR